MSAVHSAPRPAVRLVVLAFAVGLLSVTAPPEGAEAALICQHQKKQTVRLRTDACKKNEQPVFDSGTQATQDQQIGALQSTITEHTALLRSTCPGQPTRHVLTGTAETSSSLMMIGYLAGTLCRTLDDDQAGCEQAFEVTTYGPAACVYLAGKCLVCDLQLDVSGVCTNICQPPVTCPADPSRTTQLQGCEGAADATACGHAWVLSIDYATPTDLIRGTSCYWDAAAIPPKCDRCTPEKISLGKCANACLAPADLPRCRLGGRSFGKCDTLDGNPAACGLTYQLGHYGTQTCWYDAGPGLCAGCEPWDEAEGKCSNGC